MKNENSLRIVVEEREGRTRVNEPVTFGIPFPKGMVADCSTLTLLDTSRRQYSLQARTLAKWFDGSAKWVLLDFQANVEANSVAKYQLRSVTGQSTSHPSPVLSVRETSAAVIVDTGKATFFLSRQLCKPFDRVVIEGAELIGTQGSSLVLTDEGGQTYLPHMDDLAVETKGPMRVAIKVQGQFRAPSSHALQCV